MVSAVFQTHRCVPANLAAGYGTNSLCHAKKKRATTERGKSLDILEHVYMVIAAYGEWWDPHLVEWGRRGPGLGGKLTGRLDSGTLTDAWEQRGIYVLFQDWEVVYVGKTGQRPLGARLRQHLADDVAGRWDRFSWYGIRRVNLAGDLHAVPSPTRKIGAEETITTLEALLIRVTAPSLNRRRESLPEAQFIAQETDQAPIGVRGHLAAIERKLDGLAVDIARLRSADNSEPVRQTGSL